MPSRPVPGCHCAWTLTNFDAFAIVGDMREATTSRRKLVVKREACCEGAEAAPVAGLPDMPEVETLAERLKALADPTRLRMLELLARRDAPLCVCEITDLFPLHQPTISHHLRILRQAGMIRGEKRGVWSYYEATEAGQRAVVLAKSLA